MPSSGHLGSGESIVRPTFSGRFFVCPGDFEGVLKKAHFLVVLIVTALVVLASFSLSSDDGRVRTECWIVSDFTQAVEDPPLPKLSESADPSSPNPDPSQSDNSTASATSSGAVKASFTVISRPVGDQGQSGTPPTGNVACDPDSASAITPAQEGDRSAISDRTVSGSQFRPDASVHPKSSGVKMHWMFIIAAWSAGITAACSLAFLRFLGVRARD